MPNIGIKAGITAVIGAETTPVFAYLVGFGMIQMLIAGGVALATARVWKIIDVAALQPRLAHNLHRVQPPSAPLSHLQHTRPAAAAQHS